MSNQNNYGEILCQAVDEIIGKRLEGVSYDQTVLCTIVDDTDKQHGIYVVTHNNSAVKFNAVSENTSYRKGDNVYVQIPGGDWNQQKTIISKKTNKEEEPFIYKRPFESLVDITGNLIETQIEDNLTGLVANGVQADQQCITLWTYNIADSNALSVSQGGAHAAYTRLGLQAGFKSLINPFYEGENVYNVTKGDYGLKLTITSIDEKTSKEFDNQIATYVLYLNCADMNGNPYDFQTYYTQEKVFDISNVGKIQTMKLEFYQTPGTFESSDGKTVPYQDFLGNGLPPNLFTNDVYVSLGYDTSEFDSEMVYIYTLNSTTYSRTENPLSNNHKEIQLRWIHQQEDGSFKSITLADKMDYEVRWYRFELGHSSADEYSGVYWKDLSHQSTYYDNVSESMSSSYDILDNEWKIYNEASPVAEDRYPSYFSTWLLPDTTLQEEQIKAIIIYNGQPYRSNVLVCENEDEVVSKPTVDAVQALSINCEDNTYGNYRIYGQGGSLLDNAQYSITREWKPMFKSSTGGLDVAPTELIEAESIEWIIPTKKTMIEIDDAFLENADVSYEDNDDARIHIKRIGVGVKGNDISGCNLQKYRIKSYYSQSYSDNTIQCKIVKDKITYTATKELTFGIAGTSGTDCTFIIDFDNGASAVLASESSAVTVTARLYDYENTERSDLLAQREITWSWKTSDGQLTYRAISEGSNHQREIVFNNRTADGSNYNILQASIPWGEENSTLIAYLPIPIRASTQYAYISGTSQVIYNSAGEILDLFANPYIVYDNSGNEVPLVTWSVKNNSSQEDRYSPTITTDTRSGYQYLKPLSFYVENACKEVCAIGKVGDTVVWSQPILIMQNRYPSAMLNQWDGKLIVDEEGGSILAPRMAAGMKHTEDGTFSGVVLGNWGSTNSDNSLTSGDTGLYGFDHGEQTYAFKQDGTAFIGKSGAGRIEFNGSEGIIESGAYDAGQGMSINLKEGTISAHQFTLNAGDNVVNATEYLRLTTDVNDDPLTIGNQFWVEWDGTLHATNGLFSGTIDSSTITGATIIGGEIYVPSKENPSFSVDAAGILYANGADITGTIDATTLNCENGFIGGWSITKDSLTGGNTTLSSDGSFGNGTSFQVGADGSVNTNGATITGGAIQGASIGIGGTNYDAFIVDSNGNLNIGSGQFKVTSAGEMTAENATIRGHVEAATGSIGGWNISTGNKDPITGADTETSARGWNALWAVNGSGYYTVLDPGRDNVIAVGIPASYAFNNHNYAQFRVTNQGDLIVGGDQAPFKVTQSGELTATLGKIGGWTIGTDSLSTEGLTLSASTSGAQLSGGSSTAKATSSGYWAIKADGSAEFSNLKITGGEITITNNGKTAFGITNTGTLTATAGKIATWNIGTNSLWNGGSETSPTLYYGTSGITATVAGSSRSDLIFKAGTGFGVSSSGGMYASSGSIGGWTIGTNSLTSSGNSNIVLSSASTGNAIKVGSNFTVATDGSMTAKAGTIGGWTINGNDLTAASGNIVLAGGASSTSGALTIKDGSGTFFKVQSNGYFEARAGTIGTWNLSPSQLRFNNSNIFHFNTSTGNLTISGQLKASTIVGTIQEIEDVKKNIDTIEADIENIYNLIDMIIDLIPE